MFDIRRTRCHFFRRDVKFTSLHLVPALCEFSTPRQIPWTWLRGLGFWAAWAGSLAAVSSLASSSLEPSLISLLLSILRWGRLTKTTQRNKGNKNGPTFFLFFLFFLLASLWYYSLHYFLVALLALTDEEEESFYSPDFLTHFRLGAWPKKVAQNTLPKKGNVYSCQGLHKYVGIISDRQIFGSLFRLAFELYIFLWEIPTGSLPVLEPRSTNFAGCRNVSFRGSKIMESSVGMVEAGISI